MQPRLWRPRFIVVAGSIGLIGIALLVYFVFFRSSPVTAFAQSSSPDGMYRCTVTEKCTGMGEMQFEIVIDRRNLRTAGDGSSFLIGTGWDNIYRDSYESSCGNSNYSIVWEYNDRHLTTGLTIFSDTEPPYWDGNIILKRPLTTYARGGFGTIVVEPPPKGAPPIPSGSTGGIFAPR